MDTSRHMKSTSIDFQSLLFEIGWVFEGINWESVKVQNALIIVSDQEAQKLIMLRTFSKVHINVKVI